MVWQYLQHQNIENGDLNNAATSNGKVSGMNSDPKRCMTGEDLKKKRK